MHEPLAVLVDDDRPRAEAHHHLRQRVAVAALLPRLVDDAVAEEGGHRAELGADRHRHQVPVAGVRPRRHRLDLVPDERLDHLGVPLEAAAGQHDAAAGADPARCRPGPSTTTPTTAPASSVTSLTAGVDGAHLDAAFDQRLEQRGDQPAALGPDTRTPPLLAPGVATPPARGS